MSFRAEATGWIEFRSGASVGVKGQCAGADGKSVEGKATVVLSLSVIVSVCNSVKWE